MEVDQPRREQASATVDDRDSGWQIVDLGSDRHDPTLVREQFAGRDVATGMNEANVAEVERGHGQNLGN